MFLKLRTTFKTVNGVDRYLFGVLVGLVGAGFLIFLSASIGLLARDGASFGHVALMRLISVAIGAVLAYLASVSSYKHLRIYAFHLLFASIILTALVFIPGLGLEHGGARRWIVVAGLSFQPAELLKIAFVIYAASFFSSAKEKIQTLGLGLMPLLVLLGIAGFLLILQPDTDTLVVLFLSLVAMFLAAGGRVRHVGIVMIIGILSLGAFALSKPYLKARIMTFVNPAADPQGAGYQVQQSLIAIGSGGFSGRGFGQSVQKFEYLPEPIGDSVFAVAGEEFGFLGAGALIILFLALLLRGLRIASRSPDMFGGLLCIGIVILIGASAFLNIGSMLGVVPLSGLPLAFVSHGGTALVITLFEAGILLSISRFQKQ